MEQPNMNFVNMTELDYYKNKCIFLEQIEKANPCDPDVTPKQIIAYSRYNSFVKVYGQIFKDKR